MEGAATVLVIILSVVLIIFLIVAIVLALVLIRISHQIKQIANTANFAVKSAGNVKANISKFTASAAAIKAARLVFKKFKGGKNGKK